MTDGMKQAIEELAHKYALHYGKAYMAKAEDDYFPFEDHYRSLQFDSTFFHELLYGEGAFKTYLNAKRTELFYRTTKKDDLDRKVDELEEKITQDIEVRYRYRFQQYCLELIKERLDELKEEYDYEQDEKHYYETRAYVGEEDQIGGEVSEEERKQMIERAEHLIELYAKRMQNLRRIREEITEKKKPV